MYSRSLGRCNVPNSPILDLPLVAQCLLNQALVLFSLVLSDLLAPAMQWLAQGAVHKWRDAGRTIGWGRTCGVRASCRGIHGSR
jgi:hypothetical protein